MSKSSRPSRRRQEQLDSLYWAGRAKQLGLTRRDAVKKAQQDAAVLARVTARIVKGTANESKGNGHAAGNPFFNPDVLERFYNQLLASARLTTQLTIKRPARYVGKSANFLIIDDLIAKDLIKTMGVELS